MSNKYCDTCNHEKLHHRKRVYECTVKGCKCEMFNRGENRDITGHKKKKGG